MSQLGQEPGDVMLVIRRDVSHDPVSALIRELTKSPFSHSVVTLEPDCHTDATVDKAGAIRTRNDKELWKDLDTSARAVVLYRQVEPVPDPKAMAAAVDALRGAAAEDPAPDAGADFALGNLAALGVVRMLAAVRPDAFNAEGIERLRTALVLAVADGPGRLFCSEYAFRILSAGGARPALPEKPAVDLTGFPVEAPPPLAAVGWWQSLEGWIKVRVEDLEHTVEILRGTYADFEVVWEKALEAYRNPPDLTRLTPLQRADFFTPSDFTASPSVVRVGFRRAGDDDFRPIPSDGPLPDH